MLFHQLKVLIWRNLILKKRGYFTTLLEIIIPGLLMLIIGIFFFNHNYNLYIYLFFFFLFNIY